MKVTRREIVALAIAGAAGAQTSPDEQTAAQLKSSAEALDKFELKQDTEPAFAFKV